MTGQIVASAVVFGAILGAMPRLLVEDTKRAVERRRRRLAWAQLKTSTMKLDRALRQLAESMQAATPALRHLEAQLQKAGEHASGRAAQVSPFPPSGKRGKG